MKECLLPVFLRFRRKILRRAEVGEEQEAEENKVSREYADCRNVQEGSFGSTDFDVSFYVEEYKVQKKECETGLSECSNLRI